MCWCVSIPIKAAEKDKLKEQIAEITYQGKTDMGLGIKEAVELLGTAKKAGDCAFGWENRFGA
ncbi:MAG: hypothetical protein K2M46_03095 [Lachnospiraceae bacterium]|nr:hypothetical protein [Lachnospiraceae bacterium]